MAIYIKKFNVECFRGIHQLTVDHTNHVNIIAGDNNCGKTSVLEAMLLLCNYADITDILILAQNRGPILMGGTSLYECFINLFPKNRDEMLICVNAEYKDDSVRFYLTGEQKRVVLELENESNKSKKKYEMYANSTIAVEADAFIGEIQCDYGEHKERATINFDEHISLDGRRIRRDKYIKMIYLAPFNHIFRNVFNRIIEDDSLKDICLNALRLFDPDIQDLLLLMSKENNRPVEYVKHTKLGNMPLSTYGDGIKKVLSIANGIAMAAGGVLLIDEVETAIHSRYYYDIFRFIVKACRQLKVQVFITSHSIEAIDGFLGTQDYDKQNDHDDIQVITLKKDSESGRTLSRVLPGRQVYANREQFGFEVRL